MTTPTDPTPTAFAPIERIDDLEIRIAHQDRVIEDLNQAVVEQWKLIDDLSRRIAALVDRLATLEHVTRTIAPPEPPPPHY
jgi:SlyX protein